jgi:site-specific recombinase XerD
MTRPSAKNAKPLAEAMREVVRALRAENCSPKTIEGYREKWGPFFAFLDDRQEGDPTVGDFTLDNARDYMIYRLDPEDQRRPLSPVSGCTHVATLRAISSRFAEEGLTGENRLVRLGKPKLDQEPEGRVLSPHERLALFAGARGVSLTARRNLAVLAVLDDVGPRVSELVMLQREDIRLDDRSIVLHLPAKRGLVRTLPLGCESVRVIRDLVGTRRLKRPRRRRGDGAGPGCQYAESGEHRDSANQVNVEKSNQVNIGASRGSFLEPAPCSSRTEPQHVV